MLRGVALLFLSLLPAHAAGQLVSAAAQCSPGFQWLFTSVNQSPCDVAVELGGVCVAGQFNVTALDPGNVYFGPDASSANSCRCSSVYYSLLSACAYCQHHNYIQWSDYSANCSTVYVATFPEPIPLGVKVPTWAYQNVTGSDLFNINIANSTDKSEGPPSSTTTSSSSATSSSVHTGHTGISDSKAVPIAAVVGGLIGLALIAGFVAFCRIWGKKRSSTTILNDKPVNRPPARPTIPGFSAPGTPFVSSGTLYPTPIYNIPNAVHSIPPADYPLSVGGTSDIYESSPAPLSNTGERYYNSQSSSSPIPLSEYHNQQGSRSTIPTTDNYWTQANSPSMSHSHPSTDRHYDSPMALSPLPVHQTGESRYTDTQHPYQSHPSSVVSSPQTDQGSTLPYTDSKVQLLPPRYVDVVDGTARKPLSEKGTVLTPFN